MIQTLELFPGVTLRCYNDHRFKQGCLSLQFVRSMCSEEAAMNALLPAVWLRGTKDYPDLRSITLRLDELYGASVGALVRRVGDRQTTGLHCSFMEDRFALDGDQILAPMVDFLGQLLFCPIAEGDSLCTEFVESEKKNLISTIESERNDKRAYAAAQLMKLMCRADSFGLPRLGSVKQTAAITPQTLYAHQQKILRESPVQLFYVGSQAAEDVAQLLRPLFENLSRDALPMPPQTPFCDAGKQEATEQLPTSQSQLCLGFVTPITNQHSGFAAMQVLNTVFGAGMTSKLFMNVREKKSLCYSIGSGYYSTKGILTVSAGIDREKRDVTFEEIMHQLAQCQTGNITPAELESGKEAVLNSLRGVHDSPGSIEGFYATGCLSDLMLTPEQYRQAVQAVSLDDCVAAANSLTLHTQYFLEGVGQ